MYRICNMILSISAGIKNYLFFPSEGQKLGGLQSLLHTALDYQQFTL